MSESTPESGESQDQFALLVKALREDANLTQDDLAAFMGMPGDSGRVTVAFWETGKRRPQLAQLPKLAACLGYWPTKSPDLRRRVVQSALLMAHSGRSHDQGPT